MPKKATILIVDDELNLRRTLAFILQRAGYLVVTVPDGLGALNTLKTGSFDLAIIDLQLPDTEGEILADEFHKINSHLPVIILTGHPTFELKSELSSQKIAAYLAKPIDPIHILAKVEEVIAQNNGLRHQNTDEGG